MGVISRTLKSPTPQTAGTGAGGGSTLPGDFLSTIAISGFADVQIGDRLTFANSFFIRNMSQLQVSWALSRKGALSGLFPRSLLPAGVTDGSLMGKWVKYQHPTAGAWGGKVVNV